MKRLIYLFVFAVLFSSFSFAAERVIFDASTGTMYKNMSQVPSLNNVTVKPGDVQLLQDMQPGKIVETKINGIPNYLLAETYYVQLHMDRDTSDSNWIYTSPVDTLQRIYTGFWQYPMSMGPYGTTKGIVQFFPGIPGKFTLDSLAIAMFLPLADANTPRKAKNDFQILPFRMNNLGYKLTDSCRMRYDNDGDNVYTPLTSDYIYINKDTVSNALKQYQGSWYPTWVFVPMPSGEGEKIVLENNQHLGLLIYQDVPVASLDTIRYLGSFEWNIPANQTYGCFMRNVNGRDTVESTWIYQYNGPSIRDTFPALYRQPLRTDYRILYMGTYEPPLSVKQESTDAANFSLSQNVPNPVVNNTNISFTLPRASHVTLSIYNTMGQLVSEIANQNYDMGTYSASYDAGSLPSGTYFYILRANGVSITRTMQVVR